MFSFKQFLTEEKNTHIEHLEDDIINYGAIGGRNAVNFLKSVRDMLVGNSSGKVNVSVKWDGAPAVICGTNPENGKFFVGTKSVFNVTPKVNYTNSDIKKNHEGNLAAKLIVALNSDSSTQSLKGDKRPINKEEDRKNIVQSLRAVDEVIVFDSTNTTDLIKSLKPNIVVKGGEWTAEEVRKRDEIPNDIEVYVYPFKEGYSSTNIINMIKEK